MEKPRILVVDDSQEIAVLLKAALDRTGRFTVQVERNPLNVLTVVRQFHPALILLDIMMPEMDGGELAGRILADPQLQPPKPTIIFLTSAITKEEVAAQGGIVGGRPMLSKSTSPQEIVEHITKALA